MNMVAREEGNKAGPTQSARLPELTWRGLTLGVFLANVFAPLSTFLGLKASQTVSASIPSSALSVVTFRVCGQEADIREHCAVQTISSAGESNAAGATFTIAAIFFMGYYLPWWLATLVITIGGALGTVCMIKIRRMALDEPGHTFPEGVAAFNVLGVALRGLQVFPLLMFGLVGAAFKFLGSFIGLFKSEVHLFAIKHVFQGVPMELMVGADASLCLVGVGWLVNLETALIIFLGGVLNRIGLNVFRYEADPKRAVRFFGVGAILVAVLYVMRLIVPVGIKVMQAAWSLLRRQSATTTTKQVLPPTEQDMKTSHQIAIIAACWGAIVGLGYHFAGSLLLSIFMATATLGACWIFSFIAAFIVARVGSTNSPTSGMTFAGLIAVMLLLAPFGALLLKAGHLGQIMLICVAGCICNAASTSGASMQDLKTGQLCGSTPRVLQWCMLIGVVSSSWAIQLVLRHLHAVQGLGVRVRPDEEPLKATQATIVAEMVKAYYGFLNGQPLPYLKPLLAGAAVGLCFVLVDIALVQIYKPTKEQPNRQPPFRTHPMMGGIGMYLGIELGTPILVGGIAAYFFVKYIMSRVSELPPHPTDHDEASTVVTPRRTYRLATESIVYLAAAGLIAGDVFGGMGAIIIKGWRPSLLPLVNLPENVLAVTGVMAFVAMIGTAAAMYYYISRSAQQSLAHIRADLAKQTADTPSA